MVKCESLRINMFRITHTGKSVNFPVTVSHILDLLSVTTRPRIEWMKLNGIKAANGLLVPLFFLF